MEFDYDIAILGCGETGIFAACELTRLHPELKLVAIDQGQDIYRRACPVMADNPLLYGAEVKFYSSRLELSSELETALPALYAAGDGTGVTRGLAQTGASGVQAARTVYRRLEQ